MPPTLIKIAMSAAQPCMLRIVLYVCRRQKLKSWARQFGAENQSEAAADH